MELIASADNNWGIGKDGGLLFTVPEDMCRFRLLTTGNIVVMGKATCLSLPQKDGSPRPLPGRENIVLTHDPGFSPAGFTVLPDTDTLFSYVAGREEKVFLIGGASLYRQLLPCFDRAYITRFFRDFPADRYLPDLDADPDWRLAATSARYSYQGVEYQFCTYKRR